MREFLSGLGRRVAVINLDPANDSAIADIDIRQLVTVEEVGHN